MEQWKQIKNFNYSISSYGRVRNDKFTERFVKPSLDTHGYLGVGLSIDGAPKRELLHRLIAIAFIPNLKNKREINHINGIKTDNRIQNLEWVSSSENQKHAYKLGLQVPLIGEQVVTSKLTTKDILEIKKLLEEKIPQKNIAKKFGVTQQMISRINKNQRWQHLKK